MYVFRLDDASDYMDVEKWNKIESILDVYSVKPLVGIIPHNEDEKLVSKYQRDDGFWQRAMAWQEKGWRIALHGYNHVYLTQLGGLNPVNEKSEFAGVSFDAQCNKIKKGYKILQDHGLKPDVFFAPAHTYDLNTIKALRQESDIRIISDTIANDVYKKDDFWYIPVQSGKPRNLPFRLTTICLHPNEMKADAFDELSGFISMNSKSVVSANDVSLKERRLSLIDKAMRIIYFAKRKI